jgi:hypothetical protein
MKVYISIPISGRPLNEAREEADRIAESLSRQGHTPVNPFNIYAGHRPTYEDYLAADLRALMGCDAICLAPGWQNSTGCRIEYAVAKELGMRRKAQGQSAYKFIHLQEYINL